MSDKTETKQITEFQEFIRIIGRGQKRRRSLTQDEAYQAMQMILRGEATEMQLGAFLMLIRVREETPEEAAGFLRAIREEWQVPSFDLDVDWGSYAGKRRQLPWFILALNLLAERGYSVCLHGMVGFEASRLYAREVIEALDWPIADSLDDAKALLASRGVCYLPIEAFAPKILKLIQLREEIGLRSPMNSIAKMLNPFQAKVSVHGAFHKGYDVIHQATAQIVEPHSTVLAFCGDSGEAEVRPDKTSEIKVAKNHQAWSFSMPKTFDVLDPTLKSLALSELVEVWQGRSRHAFGEAVIKQTLAMALVPLEDVSVEEALNLADAMWQEHLAQFN